MRFLKKKKNRFFPHNEPINFIVVVQGKLLFSFI